MFALTCVYCLPATNVRIRLGKILKENASRDCLSWNNVRCTDEAIADTVSDTLVKL